MAPRLRDEKDWRGTFYTTGMEHSPTSATGTAWRATQRLENAGQCTDSPGPSTASYQPMELQVDSPVARYPAGGVGGVETGG